jgi:hypothetical protein
MMLAEALPPAVRVVVTVIAASARMDNLVLGVMLVSCL